MTADDKGKILVAGVGNIFLGDDAFGVEVAQRLAERALPENVRVVDFGIRSYDLAYALMDAWELVILVDAVSKGGEPGTMYLIEAEVPEVPQPGESPSKTPSEVCIDAHSMNPASVLQLVRKLGGSPARTMAPRTLVLGCEPATIESDEGGRMGLSRQVRDAVAVAIGMIEELIAGIGISSAA